MKQFWTRKPALPGHIPAPLRPQAHQARVLDALWPEWSTRRRFLIGVGGSLPLVGGLARAATNFQAQQDTHGISLAISGVPVWRVDTRWFGGKARLAMRESDNTLHIELSQALFPGTSVAADFVLKAVRRGAQWQARITFHCLGFTSEVDFAQWLLGSQAASGALRMPAAPASAANPLGLAGICGTAEFRPDWSFVVEQVAAGSVELAGKVIPITKFRLELDAPAEPAPERTAHTRSWSTLSSAAAFAFEMDAGALELGSGPAVAFVRAQRGQATALVQPQDIGGQPGPQMCFHGEFPVRLPVNAACGRFEFVGNQLSASAMAQWKTAYWHIERNLAARFSTASLPATIGPAPSDPAAGSAALPVADHFVIDLPGVDAAIFQLRTVDGLPPAPGGGIASVRDFARNGVPLRAYDLKLRRASDAFFCTVRFSGLTLQRRDHAWRLVQADPGVDGLLEFDFGSQHLMEEAMLVEDWPAQEPDAHRWPRPDQAPSDKPLVPESKKLAGLAPAQFEAARASHLTFALKREGKLAKLPLTIEALFGWTDDGTPPVRVAGTTWMAPVLSARALPPGATMLLDQAGREMDDDLRIQRPHSLGEQVANPLFGTAIEAPARLVISPVPPNAAARGHDVAPWHSPPPGPLAAAAQRAELWHARLRNVKIRAIYTVDAAGSGPADRSIIKVDVFNPPRPFPGPRDRFRASLDSRDRHELVALTALYGFPTLCPVTPANSCMAPDGVTALAGRYQPVPIDAELLLLSSQGASFRYRGRWEPPADHTGKEGALSVKRYIHWSQLGRDIFVKVEYKGFLFPLGHPAILIKQTERQFYLKNGKQFVAGLLQRFFIHVPGFNRQYPAVEQGMEARLWGHANITMDDVMTPSLANPNLSAFLPNTEVAGQAAFWPRLPKRGGAEAADVLFEFYEPDSNARYLAPQVWIDNDVAHNAVKLRMVIAKWRAEVNTLLTKAEAEWPAATARYFAKVRSARLPYLPGVSGENTDIETRDILLGVQVKEDACGYNDAAPAYAELKTTGRMEGQNQPPFYPTRRRSRIMSSQLATLTGKRSEAHLLQFDNVYAEIGMVPRNASTVFAVFVEKGAAMRFGDDTAKSGGFASPSALMVNFTEKRGPVGGAEQAVIALGATATACPPKPPASALAAPSASPSTSDDFKPREYFAAVLGDAKLLGVVRLIDILEILMAATGTSFPTIRRESLFELPLQALREMLPQIERRLAVFDRWFSEPEKQTPPIPPAVAARLQPSWNRLRAEIAGGAKLIKSPHPNELAVIAVASSVAGAAQALMADTRAIAADPVLLLPAPAAALVEEAKELVNLVRSLLPPEGLVDVFRPLVQELLAQKVEQAIDELKLAIGNSPAYSGARQALEHLKLLIAEFKAAANDARVLAEALRANLLQRLQAAVTESLLQLAMVGQALKIGADTLLGKLAPLVAGQIAAQAERYKAILAAASTPLAQPVLDLHAMLDTYAGLFKGIEGPEKVQLAETFAQLRQAVAAIGDPLNAYVDRMQHIAEDAAHLQDYFPPARTMVAHVVPAGATPLPQLVPLLAEVVEQVFDGINLGLLTVTRLADIAQGLLALEAKLTAEQKAVAIEARKVIVSAGAALGQMVPVKQFNEISARLTELSQPAANMLPQLRELCASAALAVTAIRTMLLDKEGLLTADAHKFWLQTQSRFMAQLQAKYPDQFKLIDSLDRLRSTLVNAVRALSPAELDARVRAEVDARIKALRQDLESIADQTIARVSNAATAMFCSAGGGKLAKLLGKLQNSSSPYLSAQLKAALVRATTALTTCQTNAPSGIADIFDSLGALMSLLGRSLASGDVSQLVDIEKMLDEIIAEFGIPTRIRINYDWSTKVESYPKGSAAIFEPLEERRLVIAAVIDASLRGEKPSAEIRATLSPYAVHLFGKVGSANFLSIHFDGLKMTASPGKGIKCDTKVTKVEPGVALGFVKKLSELFAPDSGFYMFPTFNGIEVGYKFGSDYEILAGLVLQNIAFTVAATLPFDNSPMRIRLQLSDKEKPFLVSAGIYGGGGFLAISTRADTLEMLEASFEYGAMAAFEYGPAKGAGRVTAGIYIRMGGRDPVIEGFFCAQGEVNIARLITMSASLRVVLAYRIKTGQTAGWAVYKFKFSIGFFDYSYSARVDYAKDGDQGPERTEGSQGVMLAASASGRRPLRAGARRRFDHPRKPDIAIHAGLLERSAWRRYWNAFSQPNPDRPRRIESVCRPPVQAYRRGTDRPIDAAVSKMVSAVAAAAGAAEAFKHLEWYCVPWGKTDSGMLRLSVRAMPKFGGALCAGTSAARGNWPAFMAALGAVNLQINGKDVSVDLGSLYLARLKELGLSLKDMSWLWNEVFPAKLTSPCEVTAALQPKAADIQFRLHDSAALAAATSARVGQLFADSLGNLRAESLYSLAANGVVPQSPLSLEAGALMEAMASVYAPVVSRRRTLPDRSKSLVAPDSKEAIVRQWHYNILRGEDAQATTMGGSTGTAQETFTTPYSSEALDYLDYHFTQVPFEGLVDSQAESKALPDPFTRRMLEQQVAHTSEPAGKLELPIETFHDRLAGLATHPWLLKALGLVIDLELELPAKAEPGAAFTVMLDNWRVGDPSSGAARPAAVEPLYRMRTAVTKEGYPEAEGHGDLKHSGSRLGCLDIAAASKNAYLLTQVDIDRTPQRLLQLSLAYRSEIMAGRRATEVSSGMQGQETVGLSLIAKDPQIVPPALLPLEAGKINDVYLHHLAIGYRPDVQRLVSNQDTAGGRTGPWSSLMARKLDRIKVGGRDVTHLLRGVDVDEGILMERSRTVKADQARLNSKSAELIEGELFRWGNWVLGAPHPASEGAPRQSAPKEDLPAPADYHDSGLDIRYLAAQGATAQRYGSGYRLGMRIVMLDGNSVPLELAARAAYPDVSNSLSLGDETSEDDYGFAPFLRYESIAPPTALYVTRPQRDRFPTESVRKLIVASGEGGPSRAMTQRVLAPPRAASIDLAIRHGMFDASERKDRPPPSAFAGVELTERGDFPSSNHGAKEQATSDLYYRKRDGAAAPLIPYYPDPWANRMIIGFYRAADDCLLASDFFDYYDETHRWPDCRVLHVDLVAVDRVENAVLGFDWVLKDARLTVRLAPGVRLSVRTWHEMDVEKLNQSAIVDQLVIACSDATCGPRLRANLQAKAGASDAEVRESIVARLSQWHTRRGFEAQTARPSGRASAIANLTSFWMLNPPMHLELLHAAVKPLSRPALSEAFQAADKDPQMLQLPARASGIEQPFRIVRQPAQTSASFTGHVRLHRISTRSIEAQATWKDNALRAAWDPRSASYVVAVEMRRGLLFNLAELAEVVSDDKGACPSRPLAPELAEQHLQLLDAEVPVSQARPQEKKRVSGSYDFGDTRARVLEVQLLASARHALDFGGAGKDAHVVRSEKQRVIAAGTERPAAPKVEYVIPLYNWTKGDELFGRVRRTREAGWFRIWMDKDWYSVGNGELLAIVCWPAALLAPAARRFLLSRTRSTPSHFAIPPAAIEPLVTRWGADPLADQKSELGNMPASALKNRLRNLGQLEASADQDDATIEADVDHLRDMASYEPVLSIDPAVPAAQVTLALYRPLCDKKSGRWYADIQIDPQHAYCPFLRLGLARYQPHALKDLRLSQIVATEFIQLLPERTTTIIPRAQGKGRQREFDVILAGASLVPGAAGGLARSEMSIRIERKYPGRGGWFALPDASGAGADPWKGTRMDFVARDNVWRKTIAVEQASGLAYSLVIEEYEHLNDGAQGDTTKLVFFDRIALPGQT